jgi:hypothetical protein
MEMHNLASSTREHSATTISGGILMSGILAAVNDINGPLMGSTENGRHQLYRRSKRRKRAAAIPPPVMESTQAMLMSFLEEARCSPNDRAATTGIFADWLQDQETADHALVARGIRLALCIDTEAAPPPTLQQVCAAWSRLWPYPIPIRGLSYGLPSVVEIGSDEIAAWGPKLLPLMQDPIGLVLPHVTSRVSWVYDEPCLQQVRHLHLPHCYVGEGTVVALALSPHLQRLAFLDLRNNHFVRRGLEILATSRTLPPKLKLRIHLNRFNVGVHQEVRDRFDVIDH